MIVILIVVLLLVLLLGVNWDQTFENWGWGWVAANAAFLSLIITILK